MMYWYGMGGWGYALMMLSTLVFWALLIVVTVCVPKSITVVISPAVVAVFCPLK